MLCSENDSPGVIRRIKTLIHKCFGNKLDVDAFKLVLVSFMADIDVENQETVDTYLLIMRRIGTVKKFTTHKIDARYCWEGTTKEY